jgi:hypothetical protein
MLTETRFRVYSDEALKSVKEIDPNYVRPHIVHIVPGIYYGHLWLNHDVENNEWIPDRDDYLLFDNINGEVYTRWQFNKYRQSNEYIHDLPFPDGAYGVCDTIEQVVLKYQKCLELPDRHFIIMFHGILQRDQPEDGGWRWHKWGEYVGIQKPQCEYIYDEPLIDRVLIYHIYEINPQSNPVVSISISDALDTIRGFDESWLSNRWID